MNPLHRWLKFNLVGLVGTLVQLAALALFHRWLHGHYLIASSMALEVTLLHNFFWHLHYTWRDRSDQASVLVQCLRFHLSNGVVSLFGNLVLMRFFVQELHVPLLPANILAIVLCGVANFLLSHRWTFAVCGGVTTEGIAMR